MLPGIMNKISLKLFTIIILLASCPEKGESKRDNNPSTKFESQKDSVLSRRKIDTQNPESNFIVFWNKFRNAVLNHDTNTVISLTKFPFETHGLYDNDPIVKYDKENFYKVLNAYLNQGSDMMEGESELDYIKNTINPDSKYIIDKWARVGDFQFKNIKGEWKLKFAYLHYETIEILEK